MLAAQVLDGDWSRIRLGVRFYSRGEGDLLGPGQSQVLHNEKNTASSTSSLQKDWILEADGPDTMQSDYKIIGFNSRPYLQQVLFPLLALSQPQDSLLSFRSSNLQMSTLP